MFQAQPSSQAIRSPGGSALGLLLIWGIIFSLPLIVLQASALFFFKSGNPLTLRVAARINLLLLIFSAIQLVSSFCAALLVTRRTGTLRSGILAGVLARLLSGITGLYVIATAWRALLARFNRSVLPVDARQLIERLLSDLLVSLLLCVCVAALGALAGRHRTVPATFGSISGGALPSITPYPPYAASELPPTPTPNGWQFSPYHTYSQSGQNSPYGEASFYPPVVSQTQASDAPTQITTGNTPTDLIPEDTSLPLPYPWTGNRQTPQP